jgi:hypothetical protein
VAALVLSILAMPAVLSNSPNAAWLRAAASPATVSPDDHRL